MAFFWQNPILSNPKLISTDEGEGAFIEEVAEERFGDDFVNAFYEHGQWWVYTDDGDETRNYSVVDVSGPQAIDFEAL